MKDHAEAGTTLNVEETSVNLDCVKNEPKEAVLDFEQNLQVTQYRVSIEYENIFGERPRNRNLDEYDNLIGFDDNEMVLENVVIKLEDIEEKTEGNSDLKHCSKCKGDYDGYCSKCSSLSHILNSSTNINPGSEISTLPANILEIRDTAIGKGVFLLKTLPKGVMFGPFEGISLVKDTDNHSWELSDKKLVIVEDGNWMKDIVCAMNASSKNLDIVQIIGNLYFKTNRAIMEGEELLIYFEDEEIRKLDNSEECHYTPQIQKRLSRIFACTLCCLGFRLIKCLMDHKGKCPRGPATGCVKDLELTQCHCCKIWLEKQEYQEFHMGYCWEKYHKVLADYTEEMEESEVIVEETNEDITDLTVLSDDELDASYPNMNVSVFVSVDLREGLEDRRFAIDSDNKNNQNFHMKDDHIKNMAKDECSSQSGYKKNSGKYSGVKRYQSDISKMKFAKKSNLKGRIKNKHKEKDNCKDYKCSKRSSQANHISADINDKKLKKVKNKIIKNYKFQQCSYDTNREHSLKKHMKTHNEHNKFSEKQDLKSHRKSKKEMKYTCSECPYRTHSARDFNEHGNRHKGIKFKCDVCKAELADKRGLRRHTLNKHTQNETAKKYKCSECSFRTYSAHNFKEHVNRHTGIKFQCDVCKAEFSDKRGLKRHTQNKHTQNERAKKYKCSECSYETNEKRHMDFHSSIHAGVQAFECNICSKKFTLRGYLRKHMKIHSKSAKKYKCAECSYDTNLKHDLESHSKTHAGVKEFECQFCRKEFTQKAYLNKHLSVVHFKSKYKCAECTYETGSRSTLNKHIIRHTGIRSFECEACKKTFFHEYDLKKHTRNVHTKNLTVMSYECSECSYKTNRKYSLKVHMMVHSKVAILSV